MPANSAPITRNKFILKHNFKLLQHLGKMQIQYIQINSENDTMDFLKLQEMCAKHVYHVEDRYVIDMNVQEVENNELGKHFCTCSRAPSNVCNETK